MQPILGRPPDPENDSAPGEGGAGKTGEAEADIQCTPPVAERNGVRKKGRPRSPDSMTNAQRQAKYRATHIRIPVSPKVARTIRKFAADFARDEAEILEGLIQFALLNNNWWVNGFPPARKKPAPLKLVAKKAA